MDLSAGKTRYDLNVRAAGFNVHNKISHVTALIQFSFIWIETIKVGRLQSQDNRQSTRFRHWDFWVAADAFICLKLPQSHALIR